MQCTPHFLPKHCKVMSQKYNIDVPNCSIIDANFFCGSASFWHLPTFTLQQN